MLELEEDLAGTYQDQGYVTVPGMLKPDDLQPFREVINRGVDRYARKLEAEGKISDLHEHLPFDRRLVAIQNGEELKMRSWDDIALSPELFHIITQRRVLDVVERLVGPEIFFVGSYGLRPKMPGNTLMAFPWHQDSQYAGEVTKHMHMMTVVAPLVDLTEENGCLWVIPGSQKWGYLPGARGEDQNMRTPVDLEKRGTPVPIPMKCGDILMFSNLMFHGSKINHTDRVRWTVDFRYCPTLESREAAGMSADERAAYDYIFPKLRSLGWRPITVRSRQRGEVTTYEQWQNA
jgi:phytanoyl-CoA hydroxylase